MHNQDFFTQAFIYLLAAVISVPVAKRLGLGSVLGYLLAGILIGPFVFGFIDTGGEDIMHFAEFGIVMMLFIIGLELRPSLLWKMRHSIFGLGGLQVLITAIVIGCIALLFRQSWNKSLTIGFILALSSTAIVLQSLSEKGMLKSTGGQSAFSILLFQDIAVIPILALLPLLALGGSGGHSSHNDHGLVANLHGWQQVLLIITIVAGIIVAGRFASRYIFRAIARTGLREVFTATALLIVVAIALAMNSVGLSPALGTFLAGVVLADNEYRHELETDIEPFKGLLLGLFFIAVGAGINFSILAERPVQIVTLLLLLIMLKSVVLYSLTSTFRLLPEARWLVTFSLASGGEFAFVLISFSLQNSILDPPTAELITIVVALSMALTPLLMLLNEHLVQPLLLRKQIEQPEDTIEEKDNPVIIAGFGRFGVVAGRLLLASGFRSVTILDNDPQHIDTLRKYGFKVYYGDASRIDLLEAAGIAQAKVLLLTLDDKDKVTEIAAYVKRNYPHVKISARAKNMSHSYKLRKLGVEHVKLEVAHSAVELGITALKDMGFSPFQAHRAAKIYRNHTRDMKKKLAHMYEGDEKQYIDEVKRSAAELEEILRTETEQSIHEADEAWDNTTLREEVIQIYAEMNQDQSDKS
jgi:monovalent cation:proton antiporter-2 (CPA2) family protein